MNLKEYFYFDKNQKTAVILLLLLIVVLGIIHSISGLWRQSYNYEEDKVTLNEFNNFQENLQPVFYGKASDTDLDNEDNLSDNKAQKTVTNEKIKQGQTIDLNLASESALKRIPGIGDAYAKRIVAYRKELGGFNHPQQLLEIKGISPKKYEKLAEYLTVKSKVKLLKINTLSEEQLSKHPYISEKQATGIVERRKNEKINSIDNLLSIKHFSAQDIDRLKDYISFD